MYGFSCLAPAVSGVLTHLPPCRAEPYGLEAEHSAQAGLKNFPSLLACGLGWEAFLPYDVSCCMVSCALPAGSLLTPVSQWGELGRLLGCCSAV